MSERSLAILALVGAAIFIGWVPVLVRWSEVGPIATAFWRLSIASTLALAMLGFGRREHAPISGGLALWLAICGALFAGDLAFLHLAIGATSVANAALLNNLAPVFAGAIAMILGRPTGARFWAGMGLALIGVVLLFLPRLDRGPTELFGLVAGLLSALFFAGYLLAVERLREAFSTLAILAWMGLASAVVLLPVAWVAGERLMPITLEGWVIVISYALIAQGIGQALLIYALARVSGAEAGVGLLLQTATAAGFGALLLGEAAGPALLIGGGAVLAGVLIATSRPPAAPRPVR